MPRKPEAYLLEIASAASYLIKHTHAMSFETYSEDKTLRFAVERNFIIIGEAMACLRRDFPDVSARFEASPIISFRNFIVHEYWSVDHKEVWSTLKTKVEPLQNLVTGMLRSLGNTDL